MRKSILIAEYDAKIATALTVRLEAAGYLVQSAPDGYRSFMAAVALKPDLILMDIHMPYGDGLSVAEELRNTESEPIPIIFITASRDKAYCERAQKIGAAGYFEKPFDS